MDSDAGAEFARRRRVTRSAHLFIVILATVCACTAPKRTVEAPAPIVIEKKAPPRALARLVSATRALGAIKEGEAHREISTALTALADALDRDAGSRINAARIREIATQLAAAPEPANGQAALVRRALDAASQALEARARTSAPMAPELTAALGAGGTAVHALDDKRALADQRDHVVAGLEAITDAVFLLRNRRAPFPLVIENGKSTRTPAAALAAARRDALAIARAPWIAANAGTGAFVLDLADMLAAHDGADVREGVAGLRLDAQRLSNAEGVFDRAARLKRALRAAVDLLERTGVDPMWVRDARDAVSGIDPHGDIAFQRAEIQDAVRATVAAFAAADLAPRVARTAP